MKTIILLACLLTSPLAVLAQAVEPGYEPGYIPLHSSVRIIPDGSFLYYIEKIQEQIPEHWYIEEATPHGLVPGFKSLSTGIEVVRIKFSRYPYDMQIYWILNTFLGVKRNHFYVYVTSLYYEGEHRTTGLIFKDGRMIPNKERGHGITKGTPTFMPSFTRHGNFFYFHSNPSFEDWTNPVSDIIKFVEDSP